MAGNSSLERVPLKRGSSGNGIGSFTEPVSNPRRPATTTTQDAQLYNVAQGLVPLMNNPAAASHPGGPVWCWPFGAMGDLSSIPPPLPPGMLPEVKLSDFRRYLHIVGDKYERFERGRIIVGPDANRRISVTDLTPGQSKHVQGEGLVAAMRQVPLRYFQEEFTLTRPETWQEECPEDSEDKRAAVLEELSQHLDVVETYLLREIAARSDNFFIASGVVQDLRMAIHRTYDQVKTLRQGVRELDEDVVEAAVTVQRLQRRRGNLMTVLDKLKVVEGISQSQMALQLLLPQADFAGALDVLDDMRATMEAEDLSGLHCFRHLPQQLMEVAEAVDELMASEFLRVTQLRSLDGAVDHVLQGLHQGPASNRSSADGTPYTSSSRLPSLANASIAVSTSGPDLSCYPELALIQNDAEEMRDMLAPLVLGLKRTGRLSASLRTYREAVAIEVKQGIREVVERGLPRLLSADWNSRETASLAEKLQGLQPSVFQQLLAGVFRITQACMRHCGEVRSLLAELLAASKTPRTQTEQLLQEFGEVAQSLSDAAHGRWTKLLGSRAAAHARLRMGELKELLGLCEAFAAMTEACGAKPVLSLRNAVQVQCRAFLDSMHTRSITQLTGLLDQESWTIAEVPSDFQSIADALMQRGADALPDAVGLLGADPLSNGHSHMGNGHAGPADPSEATTNAPSTSGCDGATSAGSPAGSAAQTATQQDSATVLVLGLQRFHVVNTALMLLKLLEEYLTFQDLVPAFGGEVARRVVELLKVFNSRTCQLVLGAGAMQVAGLKSITAKHLALSCQCLGALITLHPRLCAAFTAGVAQPRRSLLLPEFDRVLQDLTIHRGEIHSKLVAIMRERLSANVKQLPAIADRWGGAPGPREPSQFAQTNAKQLRILSQVLTPLLLPEELNFIFGRVGALFSKSLADAFSHIEPRGAGWQAQCQADLQLLISCLQNLPMAEAEKETHVERLAILFSIGGERCFPGQPPHGHAAGPL
ncbi:hypothetical protein WJX72_010418 [[Myrmecia] bisecta]|uniref:Vacuolar protein sorting-associated protein 54 n=1 Tax=[Myrmecia] bisecta TaxID=41462 RepID=A0AAW1R8W3_9CHLO